MNDAPRITDTTVHELAAEADADERSVIRWLAGLPVRGRAGRRIVAAAARLGLDVRADSNPPPRAA